jgi:hypothetical protein
MSSAWRRRIQKIVAYSANRNDICRRISVSM